MTYTKKSHLPNCQTNLGLARLLTKTNLILIKNINIIEIEQFFRINISSTQHKSLKRSQRSTNTWKSESFKK